MKTQACIWLSPEDRATLEGWVADRNTPQKLVWRSRIVLLSADRVGKMAIVRAVGKCKRTVGRWQERYVARGLAGLQRDATRRGRKPPLPAAMIERGVKMTLHEKPPAATHWSARTLAKALGISHTSVQRIWNAHGLKPHLVKTFKLSNDKRFVEKVKDVVGLYLDPPDKALGFSVDNEHHAFCTSGCHAIFYRHRCLVCENAMRRKSERQRFGSGHKICQNEYQR